MTGDELGKQMGRRKYDPLGGATLETLRTLVRILGAILVIAVLAAGVGAVIAWQTLARVETNADAIEAGQDRQHSALSGSCHRVNVLRQTDNKHAATQYATLRLGATLTRREPRLSRRFIMLSRHLDWIPPTDCASALGTPNEFRAPPARPIHELSDDSQMHMLLHGTP